MKMKVLSLILNIYNPGQNCEKRRCQPQAMYHQFKRPSAGSVCELYYILYKDLRLKDVRSNESREHYHEDGYLVPSPRYGFRFEAVSRLCDLNLTLSVYLGNATFAQFLTFGH